MKKVISYSGELNGVKGVWCGFKPEGIVVEKETTIYRPDEGKVFKKGEEFFESVILGVGEKIKDYKEVEKPNDENPRNE